MSNLLFDGVSRIARHEAAARATASIALVTEVVSGSGFGADHAVSVQLRDRGLVLPNVPVAVGALGFAATAAVGDLVLVVFADGDYHAPVVVGRLYNADLVPPEHGPDQLVLSLPPGDSNPTVSMLVDGSVPKVELQVGGTALVITDGGATISSGGAEITLDAGGGEEVAIKTGGSTLTLSGNGDITLEAGANLTLEAVNLELKGSAGVKINGAIVEVN